MKDSENGFIIPKLTSEAIMHTILKAYNIRDEEYNNMVDRTLISNKEHSMLSIINKLIKIYKND